MMRASRFVVLAFGLLAGGLLLAAEVKPKAPVPPPVAKPPTLAPASLGPRVEIEPPAKDPITFVDHVMPILSRAGCNQTDCHGSTRGKAGFKLSLFGAEAAADYEALTRMAEGRRIDRLDPSTSLLLRKATATLKHGGGQRFTINSPEYAQLVAWIAQGARLDDSRLPKLMALRVAPKEQLVAKGASGRIAVTAIFSDSTTRDVTALAVLRSIDPKVATIAGSGQVQALSPGESVLLVSYMRQSDVCRVIVPQELPGGFPQVKGFNRVDDLVLAKLKRLGLPPSEVCSDEAFVRRVYLDTIGLLPTVAETRDFLADKEPAKRARLIDRLLERDEYADFWAMKWCDLLKVKSEYPSRLWPKAVETYYPWLRESIARNKPYDRFVREMLTASGSNFRVGPANYYRAVASKDPQTLAESTALVFMGARIGCARCHGHPTENWSLADNLGFSAFFSRVAYKPTNEWKEEIVYVNPKGVLRHPRTKEPVKPKALGGIEVPMGEFDDPRVALADWLTAPENPWFARNICNRVWFWLLGRGIVHEPDDLRPTNPPENAELLDFLAEELVRNKYDLRHVYRLVLNSRTYQTSSRSNLWNTADVSHFSRYYPKRMAAEQLLDAIGQVTGVPDRFLSKIPEPYTVLPPGLRAAQLTDGNIEETPFPFLELFGRPPRDTAYEAERCTEPSLRQAMYFVNSEHLEGKIAASERLKKLVQSAADDAQLADELYLAMLSRLPTPQERKTVVEHLAKNPKARAQAVGDLVWAIFNTKEFLFIH